MCCIRSTKSAFVWVGAISVNLGFVSFIAWGAVTIWPLGFGLCALYTICLLLLANSNWMQQLQQHQQQREHSYEQAEPGDDGVGADEGEENHLPPYVAEREEEAGQQRQEEEAGVNHDRQINSVSLPVNLLVGLAMVSLGVTGFFLPVNLFHDCDHYHRDRAIYKWTTDISALPHGVQSWATNQNYDKIYASFGYVPASSVTLFSGSFYDKQDGGIYWQQVWTVQGANPPEKHAYYGPQTFVTVTDEVACFMASQSKHAYQSKVYCFDGNTSTFRSAIDHTDRDPSFFQDLLPVEGTLWVKEAGSNGNGEEEGTIIFSLHPKDMNLTLHSKRVKIDPDSGDGDSSSCDEKSVHRKQYITFFFATAIPVTVASFVIWTMQQIPCMTITTYVGASAMFISLYLAISPEHDQADFVKWWFSMSGLFWLMVMSYFHLLNDGQPLLRTQEPAKWGLVIGGLAFAAGTCSLLFDLIAIADHAHYDIVPWILLNIFVVVPLGLLGAANTSIFLVFLGACGVLLDAMRLAVYVGDHVGQSGAIPIQFLILTLTGLLIGAIGYQVNQYEHHVRGWATRWVNKIHSAICTPTWSIRLEETHDEVGLAALLPATDAEAV